MVASESGHWYKADGSPAYTIIGAKGTERPVTLRDARKHGYLPSVTTILRAAARPGLERWKAEQVLMAALTLSRNDGEAEADWIKRVWDDSAEQAKKAAERGTAIHAAIECCYSHRPFDSEYGPFVKAALTAIEDEFGFVGWKSEHSFASVMGYGGKVDLHSDTILIDVKTKDGDLSSVSLYDEHAMQVAAYAQGVGLQEPGVCAILFVSRTEPVARLRRLHRDETERGWRMFGHLLSYWMEANEYRPHA